MAGTKQVVSDELWAIVRALPPSEPPEPQGGRPRIPDRALPDGILFGRPAFPWEYLPAELAWGSGMTCWRRLRDCTWPASGTACIWCCWTDLGRPTRSIGSAPAWTAPASGPKRGGADEEVGPGPVDHGKAGSKHQLVVLRRTHPPRSTTA